MRKSPLTSLLRPREGRRLPLPLTPRRVGATARAELSGLRDPGLADLISRIDDDAPIHLGNRVRLFTDGGEAMRAMIGAISAARLEVLCEAYIFLDDDTGNAFREALSAAAGRGPRVCVLADAFGSFATRSEFWRSLEAAGVEVRLFHRLFTQLWWQPFRDHRKVLVADRRVAFTGGMNIADEYAGSSGLGRRDQLMRDTHLEITGPAAIEMAAVFSEGWQRADGEPLESALAPEDTAEDPAHDGGARIHVLDSRPGRGHRETAAVLAAVVALARERLWLTNGYFAPGRLAVRLLAHAARRGVDVRLILPGRTDVPIVRHAGHGFYRSLLAAGVRIFEYRKSILHAKTLTADGIVSIVGSTNLDARSFQFNAECNAVVVDERLAAEMEAAFERDVAASDEIELARWRRRGRLHRLGDRAARWLSPCL